ncbi:CinA family protein [Halorubellus sp. PRR65]|uniref:CinA family protein n=1 Tax=Halorubellus sp. PRR65 TaxID=3098148 RepID=UPI002B25D401|nr:CinA family protein [Halorubellus sp. PRR65]
MTGDEDAAGSTPHPLSARVGETLRERDATVAVAESCTGGLVGARVTAVPGASDYFEQGVVAYAYGAKEQRLGVNREALDEHGAVSAPVARQMARGVRDTADATWGVATTGVAGPSGGTPETPVGTVYVAVAYAAPWGSHESFATATRHEFDGDRATVRERTVDAALDALLDAIADVGD